jgi:hypothetical protein
MLEKEKTSQKEEVNTLPVFDLLYHPGSFPTGSEAELMPKVLEKIGKHWANVPLDWIQLDLRQGFESSPNLYLRTAWPFKGPCSLQRMASDVGDIMAEFINANAPQILMIEIHFTRDCTATPPQAEEYDRQGYVRLSRAVQNPNSDGPKLFPVKPKP